MKEYLTQLAVILTLILLGVVALLILYKVFKRDRGPQVEIEDDKIKNNPRGKGGESEKDIVDDIAARYGGDG